MALVGLWHLPGVAFKIEIWKSLTTKICLYDIKDAHIRLL